MSGYATLANELRGGADFQDAIDPNRIREAADAIEALVKERGEQGSCWDEGMTLPVREGECAPIPPKCELPHGHGGAHWAGRQKWMRRDSYNSVVAERDELAEHLKDADRQFTLLKESSGKADARAVELVAVIEKVRGLRFDYLEEPGGSQAAQDDVHQALSTVPADALREHDRVIAERAWDEGFSRGFYAGQSYPDGADASEPDIDNPYLKEQHE